MLRVIGFGVALGLCGSVASAQNTNVNLTCQVNGQSNASVSPNAVVNYTVTAELTNNLNEGLALLGFDLEFDGGALSQAGVPNTSPMNNFVTPAGITNPAGYGGTMISGKLVQCGGGQNTINNGQLPCTTNANCPSGSTCVSNLCTAVAPFPTGVVIMDVAANGTPQVVLTGSLTTPAAGGPYTLGIANVFANVIKQGETGMVFWATEQAGVGTITDCVLNLSACAASIVAADPTNNTIDARQPHSIANAVPAQGFMTLNIDMPGCAIGGALAADFTVAEVGGTVPVPTIVPPLTPVDADTLQMTLSAVIEAGARTSITHTASTSKTCVSALPGDVDSSGTTSAMADANALVAILGGGPGAAHQSDLNRSGITSAEDLTQLMNLLNGGGAFTAWLNVSLSGPPC